MKQILLILLLSIGIATAQSEDKFVKLNENKNFSFNADFNQKYQLFPQFTNLYQGFLVKPYERQGYYAWLQIKQDGYLKDTIIWVDDQFVQSLLVKVPTKTNVQTETLEMDNILPGRAKMLSFKNKQKEIKLYENIESNSIEFDFYYEKFRKKIQKESWEIHTDSSSYKDVALKGKICNHLAISRDDNERLLDINKITSLQYSGTSLWFVGAVLGIPIGGFIGGAAGSLYETQILGHGGFLAGLEGFIIGGIIGAIGGGIGGGFLFDSFKYGSKIELTSSDPYDKYFELDRKTYFSIPEVTTDELKKSQ